MSQILELEKRAPFVLRVDGEDYSIEYPVPAIARLESTLNRGMRSLADWLRITAQELPAVLEVGLERQHSDSSDIAKAICDTLPAEAIETVIEALCTTTFPKATERYRLAVEEMQKRVANSLVPTIAEPSVIEVQA